MEKWFSIFFISLLAPVFASAASLTIVSVSGVSNYSKPAHLPLQILGGIAGPACIGDGKTTCDNCAIPESSCPNSAGVEQAPLCACNTHRIYNSLNVQIQLKRSKGLNGPILAVADGNHWTALAATATDTIQLTWSQLCAVMSRSGSGDCETVGYNDVVALKFGVDINENGVLDAGEPFVVATFRIVNTSMDDSVYGQLNTEGVGNFSIFPGDGLAYLMNIQTPPTFPALNNGSKVKFLRAFVSDESLTKAAPRSASVIQDLPVADDGSQLGVNKINGLKNGTLYFFRLASVDEAGNVLQFFPSNDITSSYFNDCVAMPSSLCIYSTIPNLIAATPDTLAKIEIAIEQNDLTSAQWYATKLKSIDSYYNKIQETPLTLAALNGRADIVSLFLDLGANVNHQTTNGYSALMFAAGSSVTDGFANQVKTVTILLNRGANKSLKNADGQTAYDLAVAAGNSALANLLK